MIVKLNGWHSPKCDELAVNSPISIGSYLVGILVNHPQSIIYTINSTIIVNNYNL